MAGDEAKQEGKGFTVQDRRRFSPDTGEARERGLDPSAADDQEKKQAESSLKSDRQAEPEPLPEINFSTFVISLSTQALMHLGEIANPLSGNEERDVPLAKQMIDIVGMLQEKTRGNLTGGEAKLIEDILFDLRMKYVEAVKRK
ncbi:MAG: DUF1844 domain-containing protein [Alphaproteobacteria bacterium]